MRWVTMSLLFVVVMSFCFVLFIVFNWVLYDSDSGVVTLLDDYAQESFNRYYRNWWDGINTNIAFGFGLSGVVCMFLAIICYIASVFESKQRNDVY